MRTLVYDPDPQRRGRLLTALERTRIEPEILAAPASLKGLSALSGEASRMMPLLLGHETPTAGTVASLRRSGCESPILVLVDGREPDRDSILLDAGACDVIAHPLHGGEIAARVRAALRRRSELPRNEIAVGDLVVHLDGRDPEIVSRPVRLSAKENAVLRLLAANRGRVLPRSAIFDLLYGLSDYQPFDKAVDIHICRIRNKLAKAAPQGRDLIETFPGRGYALSTPVAGVA